MQTGDKVMVRDLHAVEVFSGLSDMELGRIAPICSKIIYQAGERGPIQGETTDKLLIVDSGKVVVEMQVDVPPYSHTVIVDTLARGRVCAWSALVPPHVLTASIKCIERTEMISIEVKDLRAIFREWPSIEATVMRNLAGVISTRLRDSRTQLLRLIAELIKQGK